MRTVVSESNSFWFIISESSVSPSHVAMRHSTTDDRNMNVNSRTISSVSSPVRDMSTVRRCQTSSASDTDRRQSSTPSYAPPPDVVLMMFSLEWTWKSCAVRRSYSLGPALDDGGGCAFTLYLSRVASSTSRQESFCNNVVVPLTFSR